ncbi:hypothetical protein BDF14DRAFT_1881436 [Spinellus fusiger]|nr:hypothetical protein BDF14DRAFT_1881436 [Spinellus fusiger]
MTERKNLSKLQRLARWSSVGSAHANSKHNPKSNLLPIAERTLEAIDHNDLVQGVTYILKINHIVLGLFQGWDDDMCCFLVLRSDISLMRWSKARYIPGNFNAYDAFDENGNPSVFLWTEQLQVQIPNNWFALFEEARRKQQEWLKTLKQRQRASHIATREAGAITFNIGTEYISLKDDPPLSLPENKEMKQSKDHYELQDYLVDTQRINDSPLYTPNESINESQYESLDSYINQFHSFPSLSSTLQESSIPCNEVSQTHSSHSSQHSCEPELNPEDTPGSSFVQSYDSNTLESTSSANTERSYLENTNDIKESTPDSIIVTMTPSISEKTIATATTDTSMESNKTEIFSLLDTELTHPLTKGSPVATKFIKSRASSIVESLIGDTGAFSHDADRFSILTKDYESSLHSVPTDYSDISSKNKTLWRSITQS